MKKCIKIESKQLTENDIKEIEILFKSYMACRNMFYSRFSGIYSMLDVLNAKKLRNALRVEQKQNNISYESIFHFQSRHWVMALFDACSNINSMWSNLSNRIKKETNY